MQRLFKAIVASLGNLGKDGFCSNSLCLRELGSVPSNMKQHPNKAKNNIAKCIFFNSDRTVLMVMIEISSLWKQLLSTQTNSRVCENAITIVLLTYKKTQSCGKFHTPFIHPRTCNCLSHRENKQRTDVESWIQRDVSRWSPQRFMLVRSLAATKWPSRVISSQGVLYNLECIWLMLKGACLQTLCKLPNVNQLQGEFGLATFFPYIWMAIIWSISISQPLRQTGVVCLLSSYWNPQSTPFKEPSGPLIYILGIFHLDINESPYPLPWYPPSPLSTIRKNVMTRFHWGAPLGLPLQNHLDLIPLIKSRPISKGQRICLLSLIIVSSWFIVP